MVRLVKVEGTLAELRELFIEGAKSEARKQAKKAGSEVVKSTVAKTKRKLSSWNKYVKNPKNHIKFKSGKNKGKLDLAKMSRAHKRSTKR